MIVKYYLENLENSRIAMKLGEKHKCGLNVKFMTKPKKFLFGSGIVDPFIKGSVGSGHNDVTVSSPNCHSIFNETG